MINTYARYAIAAAFVAASAAGNVAFAVDEQEPNDSFSSAQEVVIGSGGGVGQVTASISSGADVDYYYFEGQKGDVVTIDIDGGASNGLDSVIVLVGPGMETALENDDPVVADEGSDTTSDSRIDKFNLPESGRFIVGVSSFPHFFNDDGSPELGEGFSSGGYTLLVTVERQAPPPAPAPVVQGINIDVRPGRDVARIRLDGRGSVPVALLSSDQFDALKVDRASITFGAQGHENSLRWCNKVGVDVNRDRRPDLLCNFDIKAAGFEEGDLHGVARGMTTDGRQFEGSGPLKVVRGGKRHRRGHARDGHGRDWHGRDGRGRDGRGR